jgi:hypothetical protein
MIFLASGFVAIANTKTGLYLTSTANIRPRILRYKVSTQGVPTSDQSVEYQVRRLTAAGTGTAYTLQNTDPSDASVAPLLTATVNCSGEPTYAAGWLEDTGINPRQTHTWIAYSPDEEWILPATALNGIGWQITSAGGGAGNFLINTSVRQ